MEESRADRNNQVLLNRIELQGEGQPPPHSWLLVSSLVSECPRAADLSCQKRSWKKKKRILIQGKRFQTGTRLRNHHQSAGAAQLKAGAGIFFLAASWTTRMLRDKDPFGPVPSVLVSPMLFPDQLSIAWVRAGQSNLARFYPGLLQTDAVELQGLGDLRVQPLHLQGKGTLVCQVERQSKHEQEQANSQHGWTRSRPGGLPAGDANQSI